MLWAGLCAPALGRGPQQTLCRAHPIKHRRVLQRINTLLLKGDLIRLNRNRQARQITNILTQCQLTIYPELFRVKTHRGVGVILLNQGVRALIELLIVLIGPPVIQRPRAVIA